MPCRCVAPTLPPPQAGEERSCCAGNASKATTRSDDSRASGISIFWGRSRPISRVLSWTVIPLGATSPLRSSSLPGDTAGHGIVSLFGLAPGGVCRAGLLPGSRCALTAPFHPCHASCLRLSAVREHFAGHSSGKCPGAAGAFGGIFLLHFPSARAAQALPGTVPCGARTFLGILSNDATAWPTPPMRIVARRAPRYRSRSPCPSDPAAQQRCFPMASHGVVRRGPRQEFGGRMASQIEACRSRQRAKRPCGCPSALPGPIRSGGDGG